MLGHSLLQLFFGPVPDLSVIVLYPETARKTVEELDYIFIKPARRAQYIAQQSEHLEAEEKPRQSVELLETV